MLGDGDGSREGRLIAKNRQTNSFKSNYDMNLRKPIVRWVFSFICPTPKQSRLHNLNRKSREAGEDVGEENRNKLHLLRIQWSII